MIGLVFTCPNCTVVTSEIEPIHDLLSENIYLRAAAKDKMLRDEWAELLRRKFEMVEQANAQFQEGYQEDHFDSEEEATGFMQRFIARWFPSLVGSCSSSGRHDGEDCRFYVPDADKGWGSEEPLPPKWNYYIECPVCGYRKKYWSDAAAPGAISAEG